MCLRCINYDDVAQTEQDAKAAEPEPDQDTEDVNAANATDPELERGTEPNLEDTSEQLTEMQRGEELMECESTTGEVKCIRYLIEYRFVSTTHPFKQRFFIFLTWTISAATLMMEASSIVQSVVPSVTGSSASLKRFSEHSYIHCVKIVQYEP